jgi:hypothetical protein
MQVHPKVVAQTSSATAGAALAILVGWLLSLHGIVVPDAVAASLTTLFSILCGAIAGYFTPNPPVAPQVGQKADNT